MGHHDEFNEPIYDSSDDDELTILINKHTEKKHIIKPTQPETYKEIIIQISTMMLMIFTVTMMIGFSLSKLSKISINERKDDVFFLIVGDYGRNGTHKQTKVAEQMNRFCSDEYTYYRRCQFIVGTGDNFYKNGVTNVNDENFETSFLNIYNQEYLKDIQWRQILGNHDYHGNPEAQTRFKNKQWYMPFLFYSSKFSTQTMDIKMIHLDTTPFLEFKANKFNRSAYVTGRSMIDDQLHMLEHEIEKTNENTWLFVIGHHPIYSATNTENSNGFDGHLEPIRRIIERQRNRINGYFSGHSHALQALRMGNLNYLVSGAGSKTLKSKHMKKHPDKYKKMLSGFLKNFLLIRYQEEAGFIRVHMKPSTMIIWFINHKGKVTWSTHIKKK